MDAVKKRPGPPACFVGLMVIGVVIMPLDSVISSALQSTHLPGDIRRIIGLSEFFAHGFGVAVILISIWTLAPQWRRKLPRLAACAVMPGLVVQILKFSVARIRPLSYQDFFSAASPVHADSAVDSWVGWFPLFNSQSGIPFGYAIQSFPSGHAAMAFGLAMGLTWLIPNGRGLFLTLASLAALQRVAFHAHWPSDVFVGIAIAVLIAGWMTHTNSRADKFFGRVENRTRLAADQFSSPISRAA